MTDRLTDRFGRHHTYLRISLTDRCNLRCTYCMPEGKSDWTRRDHILTADEIEKLARIFVRLGVDKIRLTGGEPTLRKDLLSIVARLSVLPGLKVLALTTNGVTLAEQAKDLRAAGLTDMTISLDSLRRERFLEITRRDQLGRVMAGIDATLAAGFTPVKLNAVMMQGVNDDELLDFVALTKDRPLHARFIEYMPFKGTPWAESGILPYREMRARIESRYTLSPVAMPGTAVGRDFAVVGHTGRIGFVTSMTESFCAGCNRLRLTADGHIKSCLFSAGEIGLRDALRAGADEVEIERLIGASLLSKPEAHPPMQELLAMGNRSMVEIGG